MSTLNLEPVQTVEIDIDYCTLVYGTSPCAAVLGTTGVRKCYNTFATCQDKSNYNRGTLTQRFIENRSSIPKGLFAYPVLKGVQYSSSTVNIAGSDERLNGLGRRATISVELMDFPYNDRSTDKYALERESGAAQVDEGPYKPIDRGTYFSKMKSRWPFYAGRSMRVVDGFINGAGQLVNTITTNWVIVDIDGPDSNGRVTIQAKDILSLADDKKAVAPRPSRGQIARQLFNPNPNARDLRFLAIKDGDDNEVIVVVADPSGEDNIFFLNPPGIGDAGYPESGFAVIDREVVEFTRVEDTVTLVRRGLFNTLPATHREGATFQLAQVYQDARIDDVIEDLLVNYGNIPPAYIPKADWAEEIDFWYGTVFLNTVLTRPEGVSSLISELSVLGISVWWDEVEQEIKLKVNAPLLGQEAPIISDRNNILRIEQEQRDEDRITQIHFYSFQTDPTSSATDKNNFDNVTVFIDAEAEQENSYREPRIKEVFTRWLNGSSESVINITALRLLKRFNTPPVRYNITLDAKDRDLSLVDVVDLRTRIVTDVTGKPQPILVQINKRQKTKSGHEVVYGAQRFEYPGKYGRIAPNGLPSYMDATDEQRERYVWIVDTDTQTFPDGEGPFLLI